MNNTIGFIGLGNLGLPVATNLLDAGYPLLVHNRTASKAEPLVARGAQLAPRPVDAVTTGGIVVTLLWDGAAVESVVRSEGFLDRLGAGGIHLSMSTIAPATAKQLAARHAQHGSIYVEAPIFDRPEAAAARQLWIPLAGPQRAKERVRPLLTALGAQGVFDFGTEAGAATTVKLVGNFLISSAVGFLAEALAMAEGNGVAPQTVVDMLTQTLFPAPIYRSYGAMIAGKRALVNQNEIGLKDVGLFADTAQQAALSTPIPQLLAELMNSGTGRA